MSYILEALRKAQAERDRGQVPGLEARPVPDGAPALSHRSRNVSWGLAAGGLCLFLLGAWFWWRATAGTAPPVTVAMTQAKPGSPDTGANAAMGQAAPKPSTVLPIVVSAPPVVAAVTPATMPSSAPMPAPGPMTAPMPPPAAPAAPAVASAPSTVLRLAQMAPEQRRQLPALTVGGSMWSESPASRFVIIDGQVLREGDAVAPGLVLERIAARSAWLRWRDTRIELGF